MRRRRATTANLHAPRRRRHRLRMAAARGRVGCQNSAKAAPKQPFSKQNGAQQPASTSAAAGAGRSGPMARGWRHRGACAKAKSGAACGTHPRSAMRGAAACRGAPGLPSDAARRMAAAPPGQRLTVRRLVSRRGAPRRRRRFLAAWTRPTAAGTAARRMVRVSSPAQPASPAARVSLRSSDTCAAPLGALRAA